MSWQWQHPSWIHTVWAALAVVGLLGWLEFRGSERLSSFVRAAMHARLVRAPNRQRRLLRLVAIFIFLFACIVAAMRPQTAGEVKSVKALRVSADMMVVLDVSKSMLAEDAAPNRLARAKAEVSALLDELAGHRAGLVVFAGKASLLSPLTSDYGFFRMMLRGAGPNSVSRGGTRIGDALRLAISSFDEDTSTPKMILLITDGEDHESFPEDAAKEAAEKEIRIVSLAFGSEEGSQIRLTNPETGARELVTENGKPDGVPVISKVDGKLLRDMAMTTSGAFIPAGVSALDLGSIVDEHLEPMFEESEVTNTRVVPRELFPFAVLFALLALLTAIYLGAVPTGNGRTTKRSAP